jgi:aspartate/methionine/tyrosine aminotransferase
VTLSDIPYIVWAKEHGFEGEIPLTMSAVPPIDWEDLDLDPRQLLLSEFSPYGDETLRAGVAAEWGWGPERVFLGAGASHSHFCFAASALAPGDRVLYEVPGYLPLLDSLSLLQIEPVPYHRRFEDGYRLPQDELRRAVRDSGAKVLLVTDLHNPSGVALGRSDRKFLGSLCEETGIEVIADEMYRPFLDPDPGPLCRVHEKIVTIGGLNKVHGLSQLRVGWGIATAERVARARRILDSTTLHNSCLADQVARHAWPHREKLVARARSISAAGREVLLPWLEGFPLEVVPPAGGLTFFPRVPQSSFADGDAFQRAALSVGVNITPGRFFGAPDHVRLGCALPPERLRDAVSRLSGLFSDRTRV